VKVSLWTPGVVNEIVESQHNGSSDHCDLERNISERLAMEAEKNLDWSAKRETKKEEFLSQMKLGTGPNGRPRTKRVRIGSTPIGGGDMFAGGTAVFQPKDPLRKTRAKTTSTTISGDMWGETTTVVLGPGEILINVIGPNDEKFAAKMREETYVKLCQSGTPFTLDMIGEETQFHGQYLDGFVRRERRKTLPSTSAGVEDISLFGSIRSFFTNTEQTDSVHPEK
jgi:hypothetical protein